MVIHFKNFNHPLNMRIFFVIFKFPLHFFNSCNTIHDHQLLCISFHCAICDMEYPVPLQLLFSGLLLLNEIVPYLWSPSSLLCNYSCPILAFWGQGCIHSRKNNYRFMQWHKDNVFWRSWKKGKTPIHPLWSKKELFPQIEILMISSPLKISVSRKPYYKIEHTSLKWKNPDIKKQYTILQWKHRKSCDINPQIFLRSHNFTFISQNFCKSNTDSDAKHLHSSSIKFNGLCLAVNSQEFQAFSLWKMFGQFWNLTLKTVKWANVSL